jgi:hypothetical protein
VRHQLTVVWVYDRAVTIVRKTAGRGAAIVTTRAPRDRLSNTCSAAGSRAADQHDRNAGIGRGGAARGALRGRAVVAGLTGLQHSVAALATVGAGRRVTARQRATAAARDVESAQVLPHGKLRLWRVSGDSTAHKMHPVNLVPRVGQGNSAFHGYFCEARPHVNSALIFFLGTLLRIGRNSPSAQATTRQRPRWLVSC